MMNSKTLSKAFEFTLRTNPALQICKTHPLQLKSYYSSSLPKGSRFSNFMGLEKQLQTVRKQQVKQQKSSVLNNSVMIVAAFVLLGGFIFIAYYDKTTRFLITLTLLKLQSNLTSPKNRANVIKQALIAILEFLNATPYDYAVLVDQLNYFCKQLRHEPEEQLLDLANRCYQLIVKHNFRSAENHGLMQGVSNLVQVMVLRERKVSDELIKVLMRKGEIQQAYLGLVYLQKIAKIGIGWIEQQEFRAKVKQNLIQKKQKDEKYYGQVFSAREETQYPQIAFKRQQEIKWLKYLEHRLNISCQ